MQTTIERPGPLQLVQVVVRASVLGAGCGAVIGGLGLTFSFPIVGTFFGAVVGGILGGAFGLVNGLILAGVAALTSSRVIERVVCGLTSLLCCGAFVALAEPPWQVKGSAVAVFMVGCGAVGVVLGPFAAHGARPLDLGPKLGQRSACSLTGEALATGAVGGALLGAGWGIVLIVRTPLPTAPATLFEGGVLGAVAGVVLAALLLAILIVPRLRVDG
jgi:hypothetical protein